MQKNTMQEIRKQIDKKNKTKEIAYPPDIISMPESPGIKMATADIAKRIKKIIAVRLALFSGFGIIF